MFIFLSGINAQCLLNFGVLCFKRYENYTVCVCYAIVLVNIFFSLFLFCGEGISVSACRHCCGLQAKKCLCSPFDLIEYHYSKEWRSALWKWSDSIVFIDLYQCSPIHKLVSWMADMLIRAGHCLSTLIIDKILG